MELNTKQLMQVFTVDNMTIYNWRYPSRVYKTAQKTSLPFHVRDAGSRHRIYFMWGEVRRWAKQNRVEVHTHPKDL